MRLMITILAAVMGLTFCTAQTTKQQKEKTEKVLVAYFSATGNTKSQATEIAKATKAKLYEITPATPYTAADLDWHDKQSRSTKEMSDAKSRPALGGGRVNAAEYDIILLGFPIWWNTCPRIINTWIESQNLSGKTVVPFCTSGSSSISNAQKELMKAYPDIHWKEGKRLSASTKEAEEWAKKVTKTDIITQQNSNKTMIIDFKDIETASIPNFKGGEKNFDAKMFSDNLNRILDGRLKPGASIGMHTHSDSSEIMFMLEGEGTVIIDGRKERFTAGQCHYCPKGSAHTLINDTEAELHFVAVVPQQ